MRNIFIGAFFLLFGFTANSQDFEELPNTRLEKASDYEEHEALAIECARFLLKHDVDYEKRNRALSAQFLIRWMSGSEVTFEVGSDLVKYSDNDADRTAVYLAALITVVLKGEPEMSTDKLDQLTSEMFLNYCLKFPNLKRNKAIKKELKKMK